MSTRIEDFELGQSWIYERIGVNPYNGKDEVAVELEMFSASTEESGLLVVVGTFMDEKRLDWDSFSFNLSDQEAKSLYEFLRKRYYE